MALPDIKNSGFPNDENQDNTPTTLPTAYVVWLTIRSKFLDEICSKDIDMLHRFKEFETEAIEELQRQYLD